MLLILLLSLFALNDAKVEFNNSMLFDEYDLILNGGQGIPLEKCSNGGCIVYVSASGKAMDATKNLFIYDNDEPQQSRISLYDTAMGYDKETGKMTGLRLTGKNYEIKNMNNMGNYPIGPIVIYHVAASDPLSATPSYFEIYEGARMQRPDGAMKHVTIITPSPYDLFVSAIDGKLLNAYVRATGYDVNYQRQPNDDNCALIHDERSYMPFRLRINSPIITLSFDDASSRTQICAHPSSYNEALLDYGGIATSQGYVGCEKNGWQVYKSSEYKSPDVDLHNSADVAAAINIDYAVTTMNTDNVVITTINGTGWERTFNVNGTNVADKQTYEAKKITIKLRNSYGSSYLVKYAPQTVGDWPTGQGICANWKPPTTTSSSTVRTTTVRGTTTRGANDLSGLLGLAAASILLSLVL